MKTLIDLNVTQTERLCFFRFYCFYTGICVCVAGMRVVRVHIQHTVCIAAFISVYVLLYMSLQVFSNCSCVGVAGNFTASTGQCPHTDDCDRMFPYFLALSVITSFIISLGGTPGYMLLIRSDF